MDVRRLSIVVWLCCAVLNACGPQQIFQSRIMEGVDTNFDIRAWQASPTANLGRKVQLGGRIVQAEPNPQGVLIIVEQLPIVEHPAYGPSDLKKRPGSFEFAFLYPGKVEESALTAGNRVIVVGTTQKPRTIILDGAPKNSLFLLAHCMHIWKTEGREIADFLSGSVGGGYYPLEEDTYCAANEKAG
ncbi:MAG TPA: Slp family lipoprotein [Nitrospiraceae bacterium]|nr:Slp family lipoprotein [Nitrospiraceae bacterium]